jgi:hypothetical protein
MRSRFYSLVPAYSQVIISLEDLDSQQMPRRKRVLGRNQKHSIWKMAQCKLLARFCVLSCLSVLNSTRKKINGEITKAMAN